jgi:hypothetical protein
MPYRSVHYVLEPFGVGHRLTRTERGFEDLSELSSAHDALLPELARARSGPLLVDLRDAKGRNDPSFERAMAGYRRAMFEGFPTVVVLVRTAIGKLQVQRHFAEDGLDRAVITTSEEEAEAALR